MPINLHCRLSMMNSFSISTASRMMSYTLSLLKGYFNSLYSTQAKSVWRPSSLDINSFEKVSPCIIPLFFSQNIEQNDPLKNTPSTAANATSLSANLSLLLINFIAQLAFFRMESKLLTALKRKFFSFWSLMYVSIKRDYVSECMFSIAIWKP